MSNVWSRKKKPRALCYRLRTAAALQGAFVNHLAAIFLQSQILITRTMNTRKTLLSVHSTHHLLTQTKQELLLQLQQIEPDLRTAGLEIDRNETWVQA
jgi:hypothetical protein